MEQRYANKPNAAVLFTVIVLRHGGHYLLLERAATKRVQPGRWTGIGGRVEADELSDLTAAALRELWEESGIGAGDVRDFTLRRVVFHARPGAPLTTLLYFTGMLERRVLPHCPEGTLAWVSPEEWAALPLIDNARPLLPLLFADQERDPAGHEPLHLGIARFAPDGAFVNVLWA
ncbi:MAG: NUDIX domain-containing protein [Thermomicrobiales bacterium]